MKTMTIDPVQRVTCMRHGGPTRTNCFCSTCSLVEAYRRKEFAIAVREREITNLRALLDQKVQIILELRNEFALDRRGL